MLAQLAAALPLASQRLLDPLLLSFVVGAVAALGAIGYVVFSKTPGVDNPEAETDTTTGDET